MLSFLLRWSVLFVVLAVGGLALHGMLNRERFEEEDEDFADGAGASLEEKKPPALAAVTDSPSKSDVSKPATTHETPGQRVVRAYKRALGRAPSEIELRKGVERVRKGETIEAEIVKKNAETFDEHDTKEGFVAAGTKDSPRPPVRQRGDRDSYTEHIEERNKDAVKSKKAAWTNQSLVILPEMKWHLPQPREPVCHLDGAPLTVEPVVDRTSLIGTLLEESA